MKKLNTIYYLVQNADGQKSILSSGNLQIRFENSWKPEESPHLRKVNSIQWTRRKSWMCQSFFQVPVRINVVDSTRSSCIRTYDCMYQLLNSPVSHSRYFLTWVFIVCRNFYIISTYSSPKLNSIRSRISKFTHDFTANK